MHRIQLLDPTHDDARRLLEAYVVELISAIDFDPAGSVSADPAEMRPPSGAFVVLYDDGAPVACGGLKQHAPGVGEIKRMYVAPAARGRGLGAAVLNALEQQARGYGYARIVLDTWLPGAPSALYTRAGYQEVPPFNDNVFATHWYEKRLEAFERYESISARQRARQS